MGDAATQDDAHDPGWPVALAGHGRWLRTAVFARLGGWAAVDDVLQEVALAASRRGPAGDPAHVGAWLYRVAVRQCLLQRRRAGRTQRLLAGYAGAGGSGRPRPDPLELLLRAERRDLVRAALGRLPPRDAEVLLLKYTEGWSCRELAGRLGVGEACVEARLHRARQRLRDELGDL